MNAKTAGADLVLGADPRVDLLPPEVKARRAARVLRRRLGAAFVVSLLAVAVGTGLAWWEAAGSQAALVAAQARSAELLAEQARFAEVRQVQDAVDTALVAQQVGASTEIHWKAYLEQVRAALPADVGIVTANIDTASPLVPYAQPTVPLQAARVATITLVLSSPGLPPVPDWLNALKSLPGYADATPASITRTETGGYEVNLTLHVDEGAYANRFASATEGE